LSEIEPEPTETEWTLAKDLQPGDRFQVGDGPVVVVDEFIPDGSAYENGSPVNPEVPHDALGRTQDLVRCHLETGDRSGYQLFGRGGGVHKLVGETRPQDFAELVAARQASIEGEGYVPAIAHSYVTSPGSSAHRQEWWDKSFVAAEYGDHQAGEYPHMPDDYTPSHGRGRSLDGHRRTHRMAYRGAGVTLRMPSATAIKAFAKETPGHTFDIPVSATHPEGQVAGWVRVTVDSDGNWATRGLGFDPADAAYVSESVQCVLSARRPSRALAETGDILERRRERAAHIGARTTPVVSGWVRAVGFDKSTSTMVMTTAAHQYGFQVPSSIYQELAASDAPGQVFNQKVKGRAVRIEVNQCPKCSRFTADGTSHRCPPKESRPSAPTYASRLARQRARTARWGRSRPVPPSNRT
jgi:hypothetical protein